MDLFLSNRQQKLILYAFKNIPITFKTQKIFNSYKFYSAIKFLKKNGLMIDCCFCGEVLPCKNKNYEHKKKDGRIKYFRLSLEGEFWALKIEELK